MKHSHARTVSVALLVAATLVGAIWLAGRGNESVGPEALNDPTTAASPSPRAEPEIVESTVCAEGSGWVRPVLDDQRRYLTSLGGEFERLASDGSLFAGAYLGRDSQNWHYAVFWTFVAEPKDEEYAVARSGLWSASPDASGCNRSSALTLLIDYEVTVMRFDGSIVSITARAAPGHFEYIQYALPADIRTLGYRLLTEDGSQIDACCS